MLSSNPKLHFDTRIKSATRAFYGLHCAGLCAGGVASTVSAHMFNVAIQPILTYGCTTTLNFTRSSVKELDKVRPNYSNLLLACLNFVIIPLYYKHCK